MNPSVCGVHAVAVGADGGGHCVLSHSSTARSAPQPISTQKQNIALVIISGSAHAMRHAIVYHGAKLFSGVCVHFRFIVSHLKKNRPASVAAGARLALADCVSL